MKNPNFNLPNGLAMFRIALAPLMLWFFVARNDGFFSHWHLSWWDYFAGLIFVIASVTDFFDGYIARSWNQKTNLGAILDPLADKMLMLAGFMGLMIIDRASVWAVFLILTREFLITGLRVAAASEGKNISASMMGKIKTVLQMVAIGFLTMNWQGGEILLWSAVAITIYSGFEYVSGYLKN
jgi:CDP-diacylglycerol--glycerol-3-phosphate 3-phosphatidyltransferase